jgi:hypothetical protein
MSDSKIMFFFGAGASIPADISGVVGLVDDFKEWLQKTSKSNELELINKIHGVLQKSNRRNVDVEFLLETVEKLEKQDREVLLDFYEGKKLNYTTGKREHTEETKRKMSEAAKQRWAQAQKKRKLQINLLI